MIFEKFQRMLNADVTSIFLTFKESSINVVQNG